jgi:membrane associated rhomboid family serine protease
MIFLFVFGRVVEKNIGSKKTILMYLATGIISGVFSDIINLADLAHFEYGASGAIMGLGMIALLLDPYAFTFFAIGIPTPIFIWVWVFMAGDIFSIILSEESSVAYFAHLGGYLSAIALSFFLLPEWRGNMKKNLVMSFMTILAIYFIWSFNVIPMILSYLGLSIA